MRLSSRTVGLLPPEIAKPRYDRANHATGIVHFGMGAFHRAHQAVYADSAMSGGDRDWAIIGVSLRSPAVRKQMAPQNGYFTVTERSEARESTRLIAAVRDVISAPQNPRGVVEILASASVRMISVTISEKGYYRSADGTLDRAEQWVANDLAKRRSPRSIYGFLAKGLALRRSAGLSGLTLVSCDNLPENGPLLRGLLCEFLDEQDSGLRAWVEAECAFPSTMVDRIVPATTGADIERIKQRIGLHDKAAVVTEPFSQWVIEDCFAGPRPRFELGGAQFVEDVRPYEIAKLRMLNGAHSALAYLGLSHGHSFVHEAMGDPLIRASVERLMRIEAASTLPAGRELDPDSYADALVERFLNRALPYRLEQIAADGSLKIPQRLLETLAENQRQGRHCPAILEALAAWIVHVRGGLRAVQDPIADALAALWRDAGIGDVVGALFGPHGRFAGHWVADEFDRAKLQELLLKIGRPNVHRVRQAFYAFIHPSHQYLAIDSIDFTKTGNWSSHCARPRLDNGEEWNMRPAFALLLLSVSSLTSVSALAQPSAAAAQPAADPASDDGAIVVTAQRRSESLQRVPVSVTALTSETLENRHLNDLTQIAQAAPSLQLGTDATFSVRGVGTLAFAGTIDSSVALALDEVNLGRPFLGGALFNDLERVEVLNGPQGLLFGKNASAGLLNIVTVRPRLGEYSMAADVEFSSRETPGSSRTAPGIIARETINIPVSANSALRVSGLYSYQEPPTSYVGTGTLRRDLNLHSYSIKAKYLIEPTDSLSLYVIGDYNETHGVAGLGDRTYRQLDPNSTNTPALRADNITAGTENFLFGGDGGYWRDLNTGGAQARIAYTLPSGLEISNLLAWRFYDQNQQYDIDATSQNGASTNFTTAGYDQYSNELRIALPGSNRLTGQAGLYYFKSSLDVQNQIGGNNYLPDAAARAFPFCVGATVVPGPPPNCSISNRYFLGSDRAYTINTQSYAAFGQFTFAVTPALKLIAGGRVTRDEIDIHLVQGQVNYFSPLGGPRGTVDQAYSDTNFSWKLGAQYQFTPHLMAYGYYGRGYKGPGFNDGAPTLTSSIIVRPETSNTAEIGFRSSFLHGNLVFNVSAFHSTFDNFQVQSFDSISRSFLVQNAARVTTKGAEATVIARPVRGLTINATAALLNSRFDDFPGAQCYPTQTTFGCSATVNTFNAGGLRLPVSPRLATSLQAIYEIPVDGEVIPFIEGNWYHRSTVNYLVNQAPGATVGPIDVFGASIGARLGANVRVSLFCKNCTNVVVPTSIGTDPGDASARNTRGQATPLLSYNQQLGLDSVRTVGLALGFRF